MVRDLQANKTHGIGSNSGDVLESEPLYMGISLELSKELLLLPA